MTQPSPAATSACNLVNFPVERSTSIRFLNHLDGVTTIGFRSQKTGAPTSDYDYADPEMALYLPLISAERPGSAFRQLMREGKVPADFVKRAAEGAPEPAAKPTRAPALRAAKTVSGIVEMPGAETTITVRSGMPAAPAVEAKAEAPGKELATRASDVTTRAAALVIKDQDSYAMANELGKGIQELADEAEAAHRPVIKKAFETHRAATALLKSIVDPLNEAVKLIKGKIAAWDEEQKRIRLAEEARIRAEQARQQREQEEEYRRQQEVIRLENERLEREREEAIEAAAAQVEEQGGTAEEVAAAIAQAEVMAPVPQPMMMAPLPPPPPPPAAIVQTYQPAAGTSIAKTWKGEVTNFHELVKWIAVNPQYLDVVEVKQGQLNRLVGISKERTSIPGVRAYPDASVRFSR